MYPAIPRYDHEAFDGRSEESEKTIFIMKKAFWPVPSQGIVEKAEQNAELIPQRGTVR